MGCTRYCIIMFEGDVIDFYDDIWLGYGLKYIDDVKEKLLRFKIPFRECTEKNTIVMKISDIIEHKPFNNNEFCLFIRGIYAKYPEADVILFND